MGSSYPQSRGNGGDGGGWHECRQEPRIHNLENQAHLAERDTMAVAVALRDTQARLQGNVEQLGEQLAHFGALVDSVASMGALLQRIAVAVGVDPADHTQIVRKRKARP
jgi:hypothetical protein